MSTVDAIDIGQNTSFFKWTERYVSKEDNSFQKWMQKYWQVEDILEDIFILECVWYTSTLGH